MKLDRYYMPGSQWVAVCILTGYAEYFDSYVLPPYKLEIMAFLQRHQFLGNSTATDNRLLFRMSAVSTASSTNSTDPGDNR